ncbi:MAG: TonB-dependent receptor [Alphaproteobacteria bacterium]
MAVQDEAENDLVEPSHSPVLDEVIVTATKREKSLRDIPASISAFDGKALEAEAILSINEVLEQTPGVTANSARPGDQRIVMRGISTSANPTSTVPYPVGVFIGDTALNEPYAASITPDLSAFDLAAVEVLKGPQGTLFGGAALSGVLRYRLNDPNPGAFEARYFSQGIYPKEGSGAWTHGVVVNVPLLGEDGNLGLRAAYIHREYPGVTDDLRPEQAAEDVNKGKGDQIRISILWEPTDEFRIKYTYLHQDYNADNGLIIANSPDGPRATDGSLLPWPNRHEFGLYNLEVSYDWEKMRLISSTSRTEKKRSNSIDSYGSLLGSAPDGTPDLAAIPFETVQDSTSFQQELRLQSSNTEMFEWLVGGYYLHSPINYFLILNSQALNETGASVTGAYSAVRTTAEIFGLGDVLDQTLQTVVPGSDNLACELSVLCAETNAEAEEKALFFDVTWTLWDDLELSGGARVYQTSVDGGFVGQGVGARGVNNGQSPADVRASITEEGINPKFSATYHFSDNHSMYVLANKGFRFGGIQNIPEDEVQNVPGVYKSDYIWNYEVGLRTRWFDNTLELDVTAYHIDYTDALVVLKNALQINYYDNVGSAESDGIEGSLRWLTPIPGIVLSATGGTVDARTTEDFMAGRTLVPAGKPLPGSAEYQYSAKLGFFGSPDWLINVGGMLSYTFVGKTYNDIANDDIVNDYGTYSLALNFSIPSIPGQPKLTLSGVNLTNEVTPVSVVRVASGGAFYILNAPKAYTLRFGLEF